jgi:hypothetical protein
MSECVFQRPSMKPDCRKTVTLGSRLDYISPTLWPALSSSSSVPRQLRHRHSLLILLFSIRICIPPLHPLTNADGSIFRFPFVIHAGRQALDQKIRIATEEKRHAVPFSSARIDHAVQVRNIPIVGPPHCQVAQVDDQCARHWHHVDPRLRGTVEDLQAANSVLQKKCDGAEVGVCSDTYTGVPDFSRK